MTDTTYLFTIELNTPEGTRTLHISKPSFIIGRSKDADIAIPSTAVSRKHLSVAARGDEIWIEDLHSSNGTYILDRPILADEPIAYTPGDSIRLGKGGIHLKLELVVKADEVQVKDDRPVSLDSDSEHESVDLPPPLLPQDPPPSPQKEADDYFEEVRESVVSQRHQLEDDPDYLVEEARKEAQKIHLLSEDEAERRLKEAKEHIHQEKQRAEAEANQIITQSHNKASDIVKEAESKAQQVIAQAKEKAQEIFQSADQESNDITKAAKEEAREIVRRARKEADEIIEDARKEVSSIHENAESNARKEAERILLEAEIRKKEIRDEAEKEGLNRAKQRADDIEKEAEKTKSEAESEAKNIVADARNKAQEIVKEGEQEAEKKIASAQLEGEKILKEKQQDLVSEIEKKEAKVYALEALVRTLDSKVDLLSQKKVELDSYLFSFSQTAPLFNETYENEVLSRTGTSPEPGWNYNIASDADESVSNEQIDSTQLDFFGKAEKANPKLSIVSDHSAKKDESSPSDPTDEKHLDETTSPDFSLSDESSNDHTAAEVADRDVYDEDMEKTTIQFSFNDSKKKAQEAPSTIWDDKTEVLSRISQSEIRNELQDDPSHSKQDHLESSPAPARSNVEDKEETTNPEFHNTETSIVIGHTNTDIDIDGYEQTGSRTMSKMEEESRPEWESEVGPLRRKKSSAVPGVAVAVSILGLSIIGYYGYPLLKKSVSSYSSDAAVSGGQRSIDMASTQSPQIVLRPTYADNVLYSNNYIEARLDPQIQRKWHPQVREFIRSQMGLKPEAAQEFLQVEMSLLRQLQELRADLKIRQQGQNIQKMKDLENQIKQQMILVLGSPEKLQQVRNFERQNFARYMQ